MNIRKYISWLEGASRSLTRAAFTVGFFSLMASFLGMLRDRMLAGHFGAGADLDMYYAAFRVPDFFYNTILIGMVSTAFLPILTQYIHNSKKEGKEGDSFLPEDAQVFVNSLVTTLFLALFVLTAVLLIITPFITAWITPGFNHGQQETVTLLTRIMLVSPIFLSLSGLLGNILNAKRYFFFYSLTPLVYNIGSIIAILFFVPTMGVKGLAWGIILGATFHFLVQFLPSRILGLKIRLHWDPRHPGIIKVLKMTLPRSIHLALLQSNLIVTTLLASTLPSGSLTVFNFANNLQSLPLGLFGASYAIAAFPMLASSVAKKKQGEFRKRFIVTMNQILFFVIPLSVVIIILRAQIVRLILGSGKFDWEDTILTLNVLGVLALSLFAQSLNLLLVRAFFALHNTTTPLKSGILGLVVNTGIGIFAVKNWYLFAPFWESHMRLTGLKSPIVGLALAYTLSQIAIFTFLLVGLYNNVKGIEARKIKRSISKIAFATVVMGAVIQIVKWGWGVLFPPSTFLAVASQITITGSIGIGVYLIMCKALKCKELKILKDECPTFLTFSKQKKCLPENIGKEKPV